ncbi:MAG: hypothetical protein KF901_00090 [Myxococcales bacterium]|nr:hypothetical protein [Myxococcales bacterium]
MPSSSEWQRVCAALREAPRGRGRAQLEAEFYRFAVEDGRRALLRMSRRLRDDELDDLLHDFLARRLRHIYEANQPRGLFVTSLIRAAKRSLGRRAREVPQERVTTDRHDVGQRPLDPETSTVLRLEGAALLQVVSARDRDVLVAVALGEEREEIAQAHGIGRAAVDQIVSRFRKLANAEGER